MEGEKRVEELNEVKNGINLRISLCSRRLFQHKQYRKDLNQA